MALTRTRFIQANTSLAKIQDPITVLNSEASVANNDVGFLINRNQGTKSNVALFWNESAEEFYLGLTSNTGVPNSNIVVSQFANIRAGTIYSNIGGSSQGSNVYITGSVLPSANVSYDLGSTTNRFKTLWLSGNTIVMGSENLSVNESGEWIFTSAGNTVTVGSLTNFQGNGAIVGNLTVTNTLTLLGNAYTITSQDLSVVDSVIDLHTQANLAPLTSNDGRDIGLKFHYYDYQDEHAFLGRANDSGYLEWYDSGREDTGNVFTGNTYGTFKAGAAILANATPSTSTTTGALRVTGGVGIGGNLYIANTGDVSANIGTVRVNLNTLDANIGSYQTYANANAASQQTAIDTLDSNIGAYQIFANATFSVSSYGDSNVAAYLLSSTGNIAAGNLTTTGNVYGGLVPSAIYKDVYLGTTAVDLSRSSGVLTVDDFNTTGYAAQANLASLATNSTKTTVTSNVSSGTAYVTFVSATSGNVDQNASTGLTYNPNSGNLRTYSAFVDTDLIVGGNLTVQNISYTNQEIITTTEIAQGNLVANSGVESTSDVTGALVVRGGIGATGNIYTKTLYTLDGIRWAGNGNVFASGGGGGGGGTLTASNTAPSSPSASDFWYYVAGDVLFQYINDGDSEQWVDVSSPYNTQTQTIADAVLSNVTVSSWANVNTVRTSLGITPTTIGIAPPVSPYLGDTWYNTNEDVMYQYINDGVGNWWVDISSDTLSTIGATNLLDTRVQGNIIPTANVTYSLGNINYQWKDLYVSSNTIYIGGVPVGISNGNLLVNNAPIIPAATYSNVEVAAYLAASGGIGSQTTAVVLPTGTTAQRPTAANGMMRYNTTTTSIECYVGGNWVTLVQGNYTIAYLIVAGGGGGGNDVGGGGGAGGLLYGTFNASPGNNLTVVVGAGGAGSTSGVAGSVGGNSAVSGTGIGSQLAYGGGGGGSWSAINGSAGGSGGGGTSNTTGVALGVAGQGNNGGAGSGNPSSTNNYSGAAGGGGAGGVGGNGATSGWSANSATIGNGGIGRSDDTLGNILTNSLTGVVYGGLRYIAGGGGASDNGSGNYGRGGAGGGANGGNNGAGAANNGVANTGGGGGGGGTSPESGGAGGSGIVVLQYTATVQRGTGGNVYSIASGGGLTTYSHIFTGTGSFTFTI